LSCLISLCDSRLHALVVRHGYGYGLDPISLCLYIGKVVQVFSLIMWNIWCDRNIIWCNICSSSVWFSKSFLWPSSNVWCLLAAWWSGDADTLILIIDDSALTNPNKTFFEGSVNNYESSFLSSELFLRKSSELCWQACFKKLLCFWDFCMLCSWWL